MSPSDTLNTYFGRLGEALLRLPGHLQADSPQGPAAQSGPQLHRAAPSALSDTLLGAHHAWRNTPNKAGRLPLSAGHSDR